MEPWSAGNAVLDLGFIYPCFPWFPGGGWWGTMALHSHSGTPATHVSWLLADGVGAGSERDCHGHCGRGKGAGGTAICPRGWWWGGGRSALHLVTSLSHPASSTTVSLQMLFLSGTHFFSLLPHRFVLFPKDNLLSYPIFIQLISAFP